MSNFIMIEHLYGAQMAGCTSSLTVEWYVPGEHFIPLNYSENSLLKSMMLSIGGDEVALHYFSFIAVLCRSLYMILSSSISLAEGHIYLSLMLLISRGFSSTA